MWHLLHTTPSTAEYIAFLALLNSPFTEMHPFFATAKQVEDDDVEMICTKAVLKQIQVLTSALEEEGLLKEQQISLVQVSTHPAAGATVVPFGTATF